jgi:hypothetical protein
MKKTVVIVFCLLVTQLFTSCYKTDDGTYTDPITIYEKMVGNWTTTSVTEIDLIAVSALTKPDKVTLTSKFNFKTFTINFATDDKFNPTTFTVGGDSPALFLKSGYWKLNNPYPNTDGTPLVIELYSDEAKTKLVDELSISAVPGTRATLQFDLIRKSGNVAYVDYQYLLRQVK